MVFEQIGLNRGPVVATWLRFGIAGWFTRVSETTATAANYSWVGTPGCG